MRNGIRRAPASLAGRLAAPLTVLAACAAALPAAALLAGCGGPAHRAAANSPAATPAVARSTMAAPASPAASAYPAPSGPSVPSGFVPLSFTAISAAHWWVLGSVPCGARACPGIVTTADGGASFQSRPAPGGRFGPYLKAPPAAGSIRFADARDGWAIAWSASGDP
jgi:hypothetical protein